MDLAAGVRIGDSRNTGARRIELTHRLTSTGMGQKVINVYPQNATQTQGRLGNGTWSRSTWMSLPSWSARSYSPKRRDSIRPAWRWILLLLCPVVTTEVIESIKITKPGSIGSNIPKETI